MVSIGSVKPAIIIMNVQTLLLSNIKHLKKCEYYYYLGRTQLTKITHLGVNTKMKNTKYTVYFVKTIWLLFFLK